MASQTSFVSRPNANGPTLRPLSPPPRRVPPVPGASNTASNTSITSTAASTPTPTPKRPPPPVPTPKPPVYRTLPSKILSSASAPTDSNNSQLDSNSNKSSLTLTRAQKRNMRRSRRRQSRRLNADNNSSNSTNSDNSNNSNNVMSDSSDEESTIANTSTLRNVKDDPEKLERLRKNVVQEIVNSEDKYLQDLYTLILYYITPLRNGRFPEISSNPKGDITMLFSTIELIFDSNTELCQNLKDESTKSTEPLIGAIFLKQADKLCQYYGVFCNHQKEGMDTIERCVNTSAQFKAFLESCKQKPETSGLGLLDYLVKPFQRILKYPLLLQELLKYTSNTHPDYENLVKALQKLQAEVDKINSDKAKTDSMKKMVEISQKIDSLPKRFKLLIPSRTYVFEGTLMKISGSHDQERHFYLFNDCLMYCKKKSNDKMTCKGIIFLTHLQIEDLDAPCSFKVFRTDKNLTYILYGKTAKEKDTWLAQLQAQKRKLNPSYTIRKSSSSKSSASSSSNSSSAGTFVRVYVSKDTFKTISVTSSTTAKELGLECARKVQLATASPNRIYQLSVCINGKERVLNEGELPLPIQQSLIQQGIKFGTESSHFKLKIVDLPNSSSDESVLRTASAASFTLPRTNTYSNSRTPNTYSLSPNTYSLSPNTYSLSPNTYSLSPNTYSLSPNTYSNATLRNFTTPPQ